MCNTDKQRQTAANPAAVQLEATVLADLHTLYKESALHHRRFKHVDIDSLTQVHQTRAVLGVQQIGKSVEGRAIYEWEYGQGDKKVMLWSQMHGDEPTATMALFDLFNFLEGKNDGQDTIRALLKTNLQLRFIPMLNPDGADRYTRRNAQSIDLNRDARATQTPEGALLKSRGQQFKPRYAFNLHDQNIYYNIPGSATPVTISMLAPAYNTERAVNEVRADAMKLVVGMDRLLQVYIPNAVARYDDTHTARGFGDNFQLWGASTVLIESGGKAGDPEKQEIRKYNFAIILNALVEIAQGSYQQYDRAAYDKIPYNAAQLHDLLIRNLHTTTNQIPLKVDVAIRRSEITVNRDYYVRGIIEDIGDLKESYGYRELDAEGLYFMPAKVSPVAIKSLQELTSEKVYSLLKAGFMAVPYPAMSLHKTPVLHNLPLIIFSQKNFFTTSSLDLGGTSNFFMADKNGNVKFGVCNGYLIDLREDLTDMHYKNRVF
ncbi:M14 family zinc carboxypeptidase [Sphingobacterium sp. Mn56C]|uniref:M14 family zinc carboxypeptidase n=1 Tax=Sphingobacterium sp. Mn56C TaxID=3395261 RepID=UPI003BF5A18E